MKLCPQLVLFVLFTIVTGLYTHPAQAEISDCTVIKSVPMKIQKSGTYCFKSDLGTLQSTGKAISIEADNVTIDLNGYRLIGPATNPQRLIFGIYSNGRNNITIRNGKIEGFFTAITHDKNLTGTGHLIENLHIDSSRLSGISLGAALSIIRNNIITNTGNGAGNLDTKGIVVYDSEDILVTGNYIGFAAGTKNTSGIWLQTISGGEISGNTITNLVGTAKVIGVSFSVSENLLIMNNRIINPKGAHSTAGVGEPLSGSSGINCINNIAIGFPVVANKGCNYSNGNQGQ